ncbi:MAG: hybrid sensor histidine kinase/response regulator [Campylobacterales bacterium]
MNNQTILVVDDTISNLDVICNLLEDYDILTATSGMDALEILEDENVDLIILDIMMPEIDGFEVCKRLRDAKKTRDTPILFITASTDEDSIEKAYEVGGTDYITKPFKPKELLAKVAMQLDLVNKTHNLEKLIEIQLEQLRDKDALLMEQLKKAEMGQMISTIAHQLKQPLTVISGMMSSMLMDDMLGRDVDVNTLCLKVQDEASFMAEIIDMYRTFFSTDIEKESLNLEKIIEDTLYVLSGSVANIRFIKNYQKDLEPIKIYKNEIIQCLMNIIKNAQDNQDENNICEKVIKISTYEEDEYQVITIHDNGGGIPEEIKDKIFDNYFTTKSKDVGTGIGLHLVKQIVEKKHHGKAYVKNEKLTYNDKSVLGAKFFIKLKIS